MEGWRARRRPTRLPSGCSERRSRAAPISHVAGARRTDLGSSSLLGGARRLWLHESWGMRDAAMRAYKARPCQRPKMMFCVFVLSDNRYDVQVHEAQRVGRRCVPVAGQGTSRGLVGALSRQCPPVSVVDRGCPSVLTSCRGCERTVSRITSAEPATRAGVPVSGPVGPAGTVDGRLLEEG